ncbi:MAG TPA: rhodanese-like domain-containing protein [Pseudomonadales bacterium]|nr:rhodanese-like domain-containing protein [Pseudomonadales bacterium]
MSLVDGHTLISATQLAAQLGAPDLRVFDCTVHLRPDPPRTYRIESGREDWLAGHVPGAGFLDLPGALSDPASRLAFTMPAPEAAAAAFGAAGVVDGARIVLYASSHPMWATRVWWMLRSLGVEAAVLDGGLEAWRRAGGAIETGPAGPAPGTLQVRPDPALWADRADVLATVADAGVCTINALSPSMYRGEGDRHYGRPGHITGSVNVPYAALFEDDTQCYRDADALRAHFDAVGALDRPVVCYCGGGISATCDAFALVRLGHGDVRVYDGSMSEWVRDPDLPLTVGDQAR